MPKLAATLKVVHQYLHEVGFSVTEITFEGESSRACVVKDGHWLIGWCVQYGQGDLCPCNIPEALKNVFRLLEGGNQTLGQPLYVRTAKWTRKDTNAALLVGSYKPYDD